MRVFVFALFALLIGCTYAAQPQTVRAFVDVGKQLDQVFNEHLPQWTALLNQIKLSDVTTKGSGFTISLTRLNLGNFVIKSVTTSGSATGAFNFAITGVGARLTLHFKAREDSWPHIGDDGDATATFSDGVISGQIVLSSVDGSLQLAVTNSNCRLNNFNLDIHSSLSWLYDLLKGLIQNSIRDSAQGALNDAVKKAIPENANAYLKKIPKKVPIHIGYDKMTLADLVLDTSIGAVTGDAEDFFITTSGLPVDAPTECPHAATFVPKATAQPGVLVTVAVDEAILNCFSWDIYRQGHLSYLLTPENFKQSVLPLNTSAWALYAPPLVAAYPNMPMHLKASASAEPLFLIGAGPLVNVTVAADLEFTVILPNGSAVPAFTLGAVFYGTANDLVAAVVPPLSIKITAAVAAGGCYINLKSSQIGDFDVKQVQSLFDFAVKVGLSGVGDILQKGYTFSSELPPPLTLTAAGVDADQGYIRVYAATAPAQPKVVA